MTAQIFQGWDTNWANLINTDGSGNATTTLSNQNRTVALTMISTVACLAAFGGMAIGKRYTEFHVNFVGASGQCGVGCRPVAGWDLRDYAQPLYSTTPTTGLWIYRSDGQLQTPAGIISYGAAYTAGDVIGMAVEMATALTVTTLTFYKNGVSQGPVTLSFATATPGLVPIIGQTGSFPGSETITVTLNAGDDNAAPLQTQPPATYTAWGKICGWDYTTLFGAPTTPPTDDFHISLTDPGGGYSLTSSWGRKTGKYYFEVTLTDAGGGPSYIGLAGISDAIRSALGPFTTSNANANNMFALMYDTLGGPGTWSAWLQPTGHGFEAQFSTDTSTPPGNATALGVAVDMDNGNVYFYVNGVVVKDAGGINAAVQAIYTGANTPVYAFCQPQGTGLVAVIGNFAGPFHDGGSGPTLGGFKYKAWAYDPIPQPFQAVFNIPGVIPLAVGTAQTMNLTAIDDNTVSWSWTIDGGSPVSTAKAPILPFSAPGSHTVELTATRASDGATSTWTVDVLVTGRAKPRFAYQNILKIASSITTSNADADFPGVNVFDDLEVTYWQPGVVGTQTLTAVMASAQEVTYFALYGHNFGEDSVTCQLQYSLDAGTMWLNATPALAPTGTQCVYYPLAAPISADHWRIKLGNCAVETFLSLASFGVDFALEHGLFDDSFGPPGLAETAMVTNNVSENGAFLGRIGLQTASLLVITPNWMSEGFCWETWFPFLRYTELLPFWFLWNPTEYPLIAAWGQTEGDMTPVTFNTMSQMTTVVNARMKID